MRNDLSCGSVPADAVRLPVLLSGCDHGHFLRKYEILAVGRSFRLMNIGQQLQCVDVDHQVCLEYCDNCVTHARIETRSSEYTALLILELVLICFHGLTPVLLEDVGVVMINITHLFHRGYPRFSKSEAFIKILTSVPATRATNLVVLTTEL